MGKYTIADNDSVDVVVQRQLDRMVEALRAAADPVSIILTGSFGRGEATVVVDAEKIDIVSDYELCVVSRSSRTRGICARLSEELSAELGVEVSISWITPRRLSSNRNANASLGRSKPSISMYELKQGSQTLYGEELLAENPIDAGDIPLWEGIRLLLNRMAESLHRPAGDAPYYQAKWISKTLIACGDTILLDARSYHYSYAERLRRLKALPNTALELKAAELDMLMRAYEAKLHGNYDDCTVGESETTKDLVDRILRYAVEKEMGVTISSYDHFSEEYLAARKNFYRFPAFGFYGLSHPVLENMIYVLKLVRWRRRPALAAIKLMNVPWRHLVFSMIAALYFYDRLDDKARQAVTNRTNAVLSSFNREASDNMDSTIDAVVGLWFNICFGKVT